MECLNNVVGLSRTECECIEASIPAEDRISLSGIYIDEVEGGLNLTAIDKIDCQSFVEKAKSARKRAIDMFVEQIVASYRTAPNKNRFRPFNNRIGKTSSLRVLNVPQYAGLRLRSNLTKGAYLTIEKIGLIINQEADVTVNIYKEYRNDNLPLELVASIPNIATIANLPSLKTLEAPLKLPLYDENISAINYYVVYDTSLYGQPRDNAASCGCGGSEAILKTFMTPEGAYAGSLEGLKTSSSTYANGVFIDGKIECVISELVCELLKLDESNTIAHAIAYKAQELLIEDIIGSGNINRFTMLSKEHLWGKRNHFRKEFDDRIIWLSETFTADQLTDCLMCDDNRIRRVLIGGKNG